MDNNSLKSRYIGIKPFSINDKDFFFAREKETNELYKLVYLEKIVVLHSATACGKTSLINAGLSTLYKTKNNINIYHLNLKKFDKDKHISVLESVNQIVRKQIPKLSYLTKIINEENSLWCNFKRIQGKENENGKHLIIIDQFENFSDYPQKDQLEFKEELATLLFSQIPEKYRDSIDEQLKNNPELLTSNGIKKLYETLNIKILFSLTTNKLHSINFFKDKIPSIAENLYELLPLTAKQAKEALIFPANYKSKYVSQNNFISDNFEYSKEAIDEVINSLSEGNTKNIESFELQIIAKYVEKLVAQKNIKTVEITDISNLNKIYKDYYNSIILNLESEEQQELVKKFIENELIFDQEKRALSCYSSIATKKYGISENNINKLIDFHLIREEKNENNEIFYKINNSVFIEPIIKLKNRRKKKEVLIKKAVKQREELQEKAKKQELKIKKTRLLGAVILFMFIISIVIGAFFWKQNKEIRQSLNNSKSNGLSFLAFKEIDNDPTLSFRLAQEAHNHDNTNSLAYSALINSFYKTNVFYNIIGTYENKIASADFSPDGTRVLAIINKETELDFKVLLMKTDGEIIREYKHNSKISSASFSPDNKHFVISSWDSIATIYDTTGNKITEITEHRATLWNANFSHDGTKVITSGSDFKSMVWDTKGNKISELTGHELDVKFASFSQNDSLIVTAGYDNIIKIWDLEGNLLSQKIIFYETSLQNIYIETAFFSQDNKYIVASLNEYYSGQSRVLLIDIEGNTKFTYITENNEVNCANFIPDKEQIIVTNKNKTAVIIDYQGNVARELYGHESGIIKAHIIDDERILTISDDGTIREWFLKEEPPVFPEIRDLNFAKFTKSGIYIIKAVKNTVSLTEVLGKEIVTFDKHEGYVNFAELSLDKKLIISADKKNKAYIWDFNGKIINTLEHRNSINTATFSADMLYYLTASNDSTAILWDSTGQIITTYLHDNKVNTAVFSSKSNKILTSCNDSSATLYDLEGNILQKFIGHKGIVSSASFSPDNKYIITTSSDKTACLWNLDGEIIVTYKGYKNKVNSAIFSPNGKYVVTSSDDGTARLWDLKGNEIMVFNHEGKTLSASYSPNGKYILTSYFDQFYDKKVKLWLVSADEIINHIDEINQYGTVWKLDENTKRKYGIK